MTRSKELSNELKVNEEPEQIEFFIETDRNQLCYNYQLNIEDVSKLKEVVEVKAAINISKRAAK